MYLRLAVKQSIQPIGRLRSKPWIICSRQMPRPKTQCETLTIGQLAKRWSIGRDHARGLVDHNTIRGVFTIPSAGRYGKAIRIPLASVLLAEREWGDSSDGNYPPNSPCPRPRRSNGGSPRLKHFPELNTEPEDAAQCPEDARGLSGSNV
jgi:hypothetical protein